VSADEAKPLLQRRMIDFSLIRFHAAPGDEAPEEREDERVFTPDDSIAIHRASRDWLARQLAAPFDGPRVVVTHHLPSWRSVAPAFLRALSNPSFASDLDALFDPVALWVHGHTHNSFDYRAGNTRVVANPRGYLMKDGGFENPCFEPALLVDI
jgi:hypothetical protein